VAQPINRSLLDFEAQTKKLLWWFWGTNHQIGAADFEAQAEKPITIGFEAKPEKIVQVVLRANHSQTVDLGFEAQLRNSRSSSPRATRHLDHSATEYQTYAIIPGPLHQVSYSCHDPRRCTPCRTCHLHTMRQANTILQRNKNKGKTIEMSRIRIQTSTSQWLITIKLRNWPLDFSISRLMSPLTTKAQSLNLESKTP
jgi:hypothetical protein